MADRSTESVMVLLQNLRNDHQASKRKVWLELVVASFATLVFSLPLAVDLSRGVFRLDFPILFLFPALLNICAWLFWFLFSALLGGARGPIGHFSGDEYDFFREMDRLRVELYRARRVEQFIDATTAITFISIAGALAILIASSHRLS